MATNKIKRKRITFNLEAPGALSVGLAGDFNNWDPKTHGMKKNKTGVWSKTVLIAPGRYEYKFFVNEEWWNDPRNDQTVVNVFGSLNNILMV